MKAVALRRVSSKEQGETGYSLPAQEKLLKSYADSQHFKVVKGYSITESASGKKQREIFDNMMAYVKKEGIKIIICEKVDRLTRNFKDAVEIDEWLEKDEERQVHLVKDSLILHKNSRSQEKLNWGIRILFAKNYIDNLSEEVKKGQKEKIAQGWLPTKPPLGYKTIGEKGHKIHVIDEAKKHFAIKMFEWYASGTYSLKRLTDELYEAGFRNDNGNKIVKSRIHQLLSDPFYIGKIRWNGGISEGNQETFIPDELFEKVQKLLKSKTTPKYSKHSYLLQGLIRCKECTGQITWEVQKGKIYGHCNHYRNCSQTVWAKEPDVEKQLLAHLNGLEIRSSRLAEWLKRALKESHKDEMAYHQSSVEELHQKHEQMKLRLDRLYDDKLDGKITEQDYERRYKRYSEELKEIDSSIAKHTNTSLRYYELGLNFFAISQRAVEIYNKAFQEDRRALINLVFENLVLNQGELTFKLTRAFQILADAIKATNRSKVRAVAKFDGENFEPSEKTDITIKSQDFTTLRPNLLRR